MSGVCPTTPARTRNTFDDTPPIKDQVNLPVPDAAFNVCAGGTNTDTTIAPRPDGSVTEIEVCCPSPGPAGPTGPAGADGADGEGVPIGGTVGQVLTKIDGTDYNTEWTEPAIGTGNMRWQEEWTPGFAYEANDFISLDGTSYVCEFDHTSDDFNKPDYERDYQGGGVEWNVASLGFLPEQKSILDQALDGAWDWMSDIENWGIEDVLLAIVAGTGLVWAGTELYDMFNDVPGDENANYNGDACYSGAYTSPILPDVVSSLCDWAGIASYDVSALPNTDVSLKINALSSARSVLATLSQIHFFDMVDTEGVLKFIPRAVQTSVRSLTEKDDLGWSKSGATAPVAIKRIQGADLPNRIELEYVSEANAYNRYVQVASLETFTEGKTTKINLPVTLGDTQALEIAEMLVINSHIERTTYAFSTSYAHIDLEPSDVITLENIGDVRILRVDEDKENGLLNFTAVDASFNSETYTPSGIASEAPTYTDVPVTIGKSAGLAIELPPLNSSDTEQRLTLFPHGYGATGWPGCAVYLSVDGGVSFEKYVDTYIETTWGKMAAIVPTISNWYVWDNTNTLTVEMKSGTLSSITELEVLNGGNWCLIGEEVIGFQTATLIAVDTYELTGLLRGRRGTEVFIDSHVGDEAFILLNNAGVEFPYPLDAKEKVYYFKYVTHGTDLSSAQAYVAQPSQKSRKPWRVANFSGNKVSGNDFLIEWTGRNQFNGEMTDSGTVTQPNGFGGFVTQVLDASNADAVVRTVYTQTTSFTYTEANQTADFGGIQGNVKIRVAQIDLLFGPGYETTEVF